MNPATQSERPKWAYFQGLLTGLSSAISRIVVGHPFDTIKVRMQTEGGHGRFIGPLDCLQQTLKLEGIRGIYKGVTPPLFGWAVIDGTMWWGYMEAKRYFQHGSNAPMSLSQHLMAGWFAGFTCSFVVTPIEQVKARLQVQYFDKESQRYKGPIDCLRSLVRNNGLRGLYFGYTGTLIFRSFISVYFTSYEWYKSCLQPFALSAPLQNFLAGGLAANTFWLIAYPADVLKNRMMAQPDVKPRKYGSLRQTGRHIYQVEGWKGFYRGFVPCMLRSFPTNGAAFVAAELTMKHLNSLRD